MERGTFPSSLDYLDESNLTFISDDTSLGACQGKYVVNSRDAYLLFQRNIPLTLDGQQDNTAQSQSISIQMPCCAVITSIQLTIDSSVVSSTNFGTITAGGLSYSIPLASSTISLTSTVCTSTVYFNFSVAAGEIFSLTAAPQITFTNPTVSTNECANSASSCTENSQRCINTLDSYVCECTGGYFRRNSQSTTCSSPTLFDMTNTLSGTGKSAVLLRASYPYVLTAQVKTNLASMPTLTASATWTSPGRSVFSPSTDIQLTMGSNRTLLRGILLHSPNSEIPTINAYCYDTVGGSQLETGVVSAVSFGIGYVYLQYDMENFCGMYELEVSNSIFYGISADLIGWNVCLDDPTICSCISEDLDNSMTTARTILCSGEDGWVCPTDWQTTDYVLHCTADYCHDYSAMCDCVWDTTTDDILCSELDGVYCPPEIDSVAKAAQCTQDYCKSYSDKCECIYNNSTETVACDALENTFCPAVISSVFLASTCMHDYCLESPTLCSCDYNETDLSGECSASSAALCPSNINSTLTANTCGTNYCSFYSQRCSCTFDNVRTLREATYKTNQTTATEWLPNGVTCAAEDGWVCPPVMTETSHAELCVEDYCDVAPLVATDADERGCSCTLPLMDLYATNPSSAMASWQLMYSQGILSSSLDCAALSGWICPDNIVSETVAQTCIPDPCLNFSARCSCSFNSTTLSAVCSENIGYKCPPDLTTEAEAALCVADPCAETIVDSTTGVSTIETVKCTCSASLPSGAAALDVDCTVNSGYIQNGASVTAVTTYLDPCQVSGVPSCTCTYLSSLIEAQCSCAIGSQDIYVEDMSPDQMCIPDPCITANDPYDKCKCSMASTSTEAISCVCNPGYQPLHASIPISYADDCLRDPCTTSNPGTCECAYDTSSALLSCRTTAAGDRCLVSNPTASQSGLLCPSYFDDSVTFDVSLCIADPCADYPSLCSCSWVAASGTSTSPTASCTCINGLFSSADTSTVSTFVDASSCRPCPVSSSASTLDTCTCTSGATSAANCSCQSGFLFSPPISHSLLDISYVSSPYWCASNPCASSTANCHCYVDKEQSPLQSLYSSVTEMQSPGLMVCPCNDGYFRRSNSLSDICLPAIPRSPTISDQRQVSKVVSYNFLTTAFVSTSMKLFSWSGRLIYDSESDMNSTAQELVTNRSIPYSTLISTSEGLDRISQNANLATSRSVTVLAVSNLFDGNDFLTVFPSIAMTTEFTLPSITSTVSTTQPPVILGIYYGGDPGLFAVSLSVNCTATSGTVTEQTTEIMYRTFASIYFKFSSPIICKTISIRPVAPPTATVVTIGEVGLDLGICSRNSTIGGLDCGGGSCIPSTDYESGGYCLCSNGTISSSSCGSTTSVSCDSVDCGDNATCQEIVNSSGVTVQTTCVCSAGYTFIGSKCYPYVITGDSIEDAAANFGGEFSIVILILISLFNI